MIIKMFRSILLIIITALLWGCYPEGPQYYDDYDIVFTNYDKEYTYPGHPNYFMPDKIIKITGELASGNMPEFIDPAYATAILSKIKANMTSLGYTYVDDSGNADLALIPSAIESENYQYYYDYWYDYWGWGWYYPYPVVYSYRTGSLIMNLIDLNEFSPDGKRRIVWTGVINGLLEGKSSDFINRMNSTVDQAFSQSDYLLQ